MPVDSSIHDFPTDAWLEVVEQSWTRDVFFNNFLYFKQRILLHLAQMGFTTLTPLITRFSIELWKAVAVLVLAVTLKYMAKGHLASASRDRCCRFQVQLRSNISNTRDSVSSGYPNTEKRVEKYDAQREYFWRNSRCLDGRWNTVSSVWYIFSIETKNQGINVEVKSSKSMLIKTGYPNLLHGCDFLCLNLMNY